MEPYYQTENVTLYHGDCLDILPELQADIVIADPPYGIDYQSARRIDRTQWKPKIQNDTAPFVSWIPDSFNVLTEGGRLICFYRWDVQDEFYNALDEAGFTIKSQIIWDKVVHGMGDLAGEFAPQHENMIYATRGRYTFTSARPKSVIRCQRVNAESLLHPNEKPAGLIEELILSLTERNDLVLDPFIGSGTTAIAAIRIGRRCIGIDISSEYLDVAIQRIERELQQPRLFVVQSKPQAEQVKLWQ